MALKTVCERHGVPLRAETDLAELIVQLGDDRPSDILVPAIHRNRTEIREIFAARMGRAVARGTLGAAASGLA
ncbi:hypothetical protein ACFVVA_01595 [Kitasatospora sp. NPDC058048]|uniref:hypothetical protein n=1 Tax=Kitasatospora sp. NPDC058048 TaxID=3346313 RepID=UPI0036DD526A